MLGADYVANPSWSKDAELGHDVRPDRLLFLTR
jgi:hypothetical protein